MALIWINSAVVLCASIILGVVLIPFLRRLKAGQFIRQEGPQSHLQKAGTPTMGGLIFILPWTLGTLLFLGINRITLALALGTLGFGAIGFVDDYIKVVLKRNLGLRAYQKIIGQFVGAIALILVIGVQETQVFIPGLNVYWDLGLLYYPFAVFFIIAVTNSVNLTDGLDGLASSISFVFLIMMALVAALLSQQLIVFSNVMFAFALLGFLVFNRYPAKVFMGDVGSLAIGGYLAAMVMILKVHLLFLVMGIIFVAEATSVVLQVTWYKRTKKRLFKMAPLHHHFELSGWKEVKVVSVFLGVTVIFGLLGYWMM